MVVKSALFRMKGVCKSSLLSACPEHFSNYFSTCFS